VRRAAAGADHIHDRVHHLRLRYLAMLVPPGREGPDRRSGQVHGSSLVTELLGPGEQLAQRPLALRRKPLVHADQRGLCGWIAEQKPPRRRPLGEEAQIGIESGAKPGLGGVGRQRARNMRQQVARLRLGNRLEEPRLRSEVVVQDRFCDPGALADVGDRRRVVAQLSKQLEPCLQHPLATGLVGTQLRAPRHPDSLLDRSVESW
jgi:hypothetical protein